jgi:tyrosine-specific transport protein
VKKELISVSLIVGNLIGAGILVFSLKAAQVGFIPALVIMILMAYLMGRTAFVLIDESVVQSRSTFNYPSLYDLHCGPLGRVLAVVSNLMILYGLLAMYTMTMSTIGLSMNIHHLSFAHANILVYGILLATLFMSIRMARMINLVFVIAMWILYLVIMGYSLPSVNIAYLTTKNISQLPYVIPAVLTAFHFHNIIPQICALHAWDKQITRRVVVIALLCGCVMYGLWVLIVSGVIDAKTIEVALKNKEPATVPLSLFSDTIGVGSYILNGFAVCAIITSFIANALGLIDFVKDLIHPYSKNRMVLYTVTFFPPLFISILFGKDIFLLMDIVGGIGIVMLFGILPMYIRLKNSQQKQIYDVIIMALFVLFLLFEIVKEYTSLFT